MEDLKVLHEGDVGFKEATHIWNAFCSKRPWGVVMCSCAEDVARAVRFARQHHRPVAVLGGGHNVAGLALGGHQEEEEEKERALVISLSRMRRTHVDAQSRTCWAEGGCLGRDVDGATGMQHQLYVAGLGLISETGIGGLATGGGVGWLARRYGMAIDSIEALDAVNANGDVVNGISRQNEPELFFGLCGATSNLGIVTRFHFRLVHVPFVAVSYLSFSSNHLNAMLTYGKVLPTLPDRVTALGFLSSEHNLLERFLIMVAIIPDEGETDMDKVLRELSEFEKKFCATSGCDWSNTEVMPLYELQKKFDEGNRPDRRYYWKSQFLQNMDKFPQICEAVIHCVTHGAPKTGCSVEFVHFGGQIARGTTGCFAHRNVALEMHSICVWDDPNGDEQRVQWSRHFGHAIAKVFAANEEDLPGNINILGPGQRNESTTRKAYGEHFERLREAKRKFDPDNLFRANHNVNPK